MQTRVGQSIEDESMRLIDSEIGEHTYTKLEWPIVRRVIHSTADFDFARTSPIIFHGSAVRAGIDALREGASIVADVHGVTGLISSHYTSKFGNQVICRIQEPNVAKRATNENTTRSRAAIRESLKEIDKGIVVIGNAPTALLELLDIISKRQAKPSLIVGVPVGFVSAVESKEALASSGLVCITNSGRKGGSAAAASILNAIFKLI